jgi:hypothetical protein
MKKTLITAALVSLVAGPAFAQQGTPRSGTNSPTATNDNPSSCLGAERATRNSNGGDRAQGEFGPEQAEFVRAMKAAGFTYGEILAMFREGCANGPPGRR